MSVRLHSPRAGRVKYVAALVAALGVACDRIQPTVGAEAPLNSCPPHPCEAFGPASTGAAQNCELAPCCVDGACLVLARPDNLVLVVTLADESYFAPGRTFLLSLPTLVGDAGLGSTLTGPVRLPELGMLQAQYTITPGAAASPPPAGLGYDLGNPGMYTSVPVQASFRMFWPPSSPILAESIGLPVPPVVADSVATVGSPGPNSSQSIWYKTYLAPGGYQRLLRPTPPFDQRIPPELKPYTVRAGQLIDPGGTPDPVTQFDVTKMYQGSTVPVFAFASEEGPLDGWTAYLRDSTGQIISNVFPLQGSSVSGAVIGTYRGGEALLNATLVVAPPLGVSLPAALFPLNLAGSLDFTYLAQPKPATLAGRVLGPAALPIQADLTFEARAITIATGMSYPSSFEYKALTSTMAGGGYSLTLPVGEYRVTVRPQLPSYPVTVFEQVHVASVLPSPADFMVGTLPSVVGSAVLADGRPLSGAAVDAVPIDCADLISNAGDDGGPTIGALAPTSCLPRPAQTTTRADGSFSLNVDPGTFILRLRPADGTRLPWVLRPMIVAAQTSSEPTPPPSGLYIRIPAPSYVGLTLADPKGNPIVHAGVRAFWVPSNGSAVELGSAFTGSDGHYDMYITTPPL